MKNKEDLTIGEMVVKDYRTASIFELYGMDFCCGGAKSINQVCSEKNIDKNEVMTLIEKLDEADPDKVDYASWDLDRLIEHIQTKHHTYVEEKMPVIMAFLEKLTSVHGDRHPELHEVKDLFKSACGDLAIHMKKEELVLFPYVMKLESAFRKGEPVGVPAFNSVRNPITSMEKDHNIEGERFRRISEITQGYVVPSDGCNTYMVAMNMLKDFEEDLHVHIHLENNILFPGAQSLEDKVRKAVAE